MTIKVKLYEEHINLHPTISISGKTMNIVVSIAEEIYSSLTAIKLPPPLTLQTFAKSLSARQTMKFGVK